ncbi:MAG: ABC transporter substrate-binding protein [Anaerolineae bacterium]|nr:ABC transporter substrate-binding protein [Anaerolineae bacterium]
MTVRDVLFRKSWVLIFLILVLAVQPAAAQDVPREETLIVALSGQIADPTNLNIYAPGVSRSGTGIHQMIYEYFFYQNLQTGEYIPWLAESYEYNDDFTAITVTLRDGVKWSDGEPFTTEDVVFTYETLMANPGMTWASEVTKNVASVEAADALTVTFNLTESNPRYHLNREAFPGVGIWGGITILPKHIWEGQDPLTFKSSDPIGTGAYTLASASQTTMVYERNDDWWGKDVFGVLPAPRAVSFQYLGDPTNVAFALAADEIDTPFIGILSLGPYLAVAARNPNVSAWTSEPPYAWLDPCPRPLMVQNATPPFDDPEMRRALSFYIDRQAVVDLAYEGTTVPSWGVWPFYDGLDPYFDAIQDLITQDRMGEYDPAAGDEIMTALGYAKNADGLWASADGALVHVNYVVDASSTEETRVGKVVADQLKAAGFDVEEQTLTGSVLSDMLLRGDYTIKLHSFCPGYIYDNLLLYHGKFYVPLGEPAPWYERNSFRYNNPAFDAIVDEMGVTPPDDVEKNVELFRQAVEILFQDMPTVPMVQAPALVPFSSTYWTGWPSAENPWNMPVSWWATFNTVIIGYPDPETGEWVGGIQPAGG